MKKTYKLELEVALDEADEQKIIAAARLHFHSTGHAEAPVGQDGQTWREVSAEEAVPDTVEAIIELICGDAILEDAGVELVSVSCNEAKSGAAWQGPDENRAEAQVLGAFEADGQDASALDEFETGMYLCRWPNGEFSLVQAETRRDALVQLDEWAAANPSNLVPMDICMVDFRLNSSGKIELKQFGEETEWIIWDHCYPELDRALSSVGVASSGDRQRTREARNLIRRAVNHERTRLWKKQSLCHPAKTEAGRQLQEQLGMAGPVADYYIEKSAKRILESKIPENGKPN
jgi:hypothetical protein